MQKSQIRSTFQDFVEHLEIQKLRCAAALDDSNLNFRGILHSKDGKEPPKGFEKFFRKRNDRKAEKQGEDEEKSQGKLRCSKVHFEWLFLFD